MDVETYRAALLQKRGELLGASTAKPLQWTVREQFRPTGRYG